MKGSIRIPVSALPVVMLFIAIPNSGRMRAFFSTEPIAPRNQTDPMTWSPHTTVATVVEKDGRFLMVEETDGGMAVFNQPAGHLDANETLFQAAVRETLEETGWHVTLTAFLGTYVYDAPNGVTYVRHSFIASADSHDPEITLDTGIIAAHWLAPETMLADDFPARSPLVLKTLSDYLSGRRLPLDTVYHHNSHD